MTPASHFSTSSGTSPFRKEAETWVRLGNHPNIVPAYWVDEIAGQIFVAAEFVESDELGRTTLRDYLQYGPLKAGAVAVWTADFCYGLAHALSKGLVAHRDIKPENLLIGDTGVLRLTDFGISSSIAKSSFSEGNEQAGHHPHLADVVQVSGTPPYMAPEQWGNMMQDSRTDIYAFGVVIYEMCYGRLPFLALNFKAFAQMHRNFPPEIPGGPFAKIIAKCLSKAPSARYAGPSDLLKDIILLKDSHGFSLPPRPLQQQSRALDLEALAHALGSLGKVPDALRAAHELVELEPTGAGNWTQLARLYLISGKTEAARSAIQHSLTLDPSRSPAWNNLGVILARQQEWSQAVVAFDRALDCDPANSGALLNSADALLQQNRPGEALLRLDRAVKYAPDKFSVWHNLGALYIKIGHKRSALACLEKAKAIAPENHYLKIEDAIKIAKKLADEVSGAAAMLAGDSTLARSRLLEETQQQPKNQVAWHNLGLSYIQTKEYELARNCFTKVFTMNPTDGFAVCRLIESSAMLRDLKAVDHRCTELSQMANGQTAAIAFKARSLVQCDQYQDGKRLILQAVKNYPNEPDVLIACGDIMMVYPGSETAMYNAVQAYQQAVKILRHLVNDIPRLRDIESRLIQAEAHFARNQKEQIN